MSPKLISTQRLLHIIEKKYACTHMLRSARAHPRCISHSSSAHARTSLDSRVHAHQADHTQKSESSNVFKHNKHCKHAQTERSHRHGQGSGHVRTKGWGRRHQIYVSKNQPTRSLLTFVSQDMLLVKASMSKNGPIAECLTGQRLSWYLQLRCSCACAIASPQPTCHGSCHWLKCAFYAGSGWCVKGRRKRMRQPPWSVVRHAFLELHRLMLAGLP